jgi:hypothetical protein
MSKNNFSDSLVEEYDLFGKVFPFHDELQQAIPQSLKEHFSDDSNGGLLVVTHREKETPFQKGHILQQVNLKNYF